MIINILLPFYIVTWYNEIESIVVDVGIILYLKKYSFLKQKNSKIYIKIVLILYWYESEHDREGNIVTVIKYNNFFKIYEIYLSKSPIRKL